MNLKDALNLAKAGRPELAAEQVAPRVAAYLARFPHHCGQRFTVRDLVSRSIRGARCRAHGRDEHGPRL